MIRASCLEFLLVVSPAATWMQAAFAASVLIGGVGLWLNPREVDSAFAGILLLQMFSASSGFTVCAARGYCDPLLACEASRGRIALASFAASTLPGLLAWITIALIASLLGHPGLAFAPHRLTALLLVSTVAWTGGLALPRLAAGALWSFVLLAIALSRGAAAQYLLVVQSTPADPLHVLLSAAILAICPFLLLGDFAASASVPVLTIDLLVAVLALSSGLRYLRRREYGLMEPV